MSPRILIITPAFNEEATIGEVVASLEKELPSADILVVNDGSPDSTSEIISQLNVRVLEHPFNLGIGATMQTGYCYAHKHGYDMAVQVDADGQHPPDQVRHLLEPVEKGEVDVAIGTRFYGAEYAHSWTRLTGIKILSKVVSFILGTKITDTTSGFRGVNRGVIEFFSRNYPEDYPEAEAIVLLHRAGFSIKEVSVRFEERKGGVSSISFLNGIYYMIKVLLAIFVDLLKKIER
jgi:glycosyltransferase involved in cell wall biosynthesis